jgi:hypothetical protein
MIGRIISLIVGIVFIVIVVIEQTKIEDAIPQMQHGAAICSSILGRLVSMISGSMSQNCQQVSDASSIIAYGQIMVQVIWTVGILCLSLGLVSIIGDLLKRRRVPVE